MNDCDIERLADDVVAAYGQSTPPVDLRNIAGEEGIELAEGDYGEDFHGRIEYLSEVEAFAIYHPRLECARYPGRVRFSIAHELGHYFIPAHREVLLTGACHNSDDCFLGGSSVEKEADKFASALLVPSVELRRLVGARKFLTLAQILELADRCQASAQATAFRYTRFTEEPHIAIVSQNGRILYHFASEEAEAIGFRWLGNRNVPMSCATRRAGMAPVGGGIVEGASGSENWFSSRRASAELWEEAIRLGTTDLVLTLLSWQDYEPNYEQEDDN